MRLFGKATVAVAFSLMLTAASVIVLASPLAPDELSPPRITSPIYEGAEVVEVWGTYPKASIRVYASGTDIGGGSCWFSRCTFNVTKVTAGQKITAKQTVEGVTSYPTIDEHAVTVQKIPDQSLDPKYNKERLRPPIVDSPLFECQRIVPVKNVVAGAQVQAFASPDTTNPIGRIKTPWNYARPGTTELEKDQKISANQTLQFPTPSDLSSPEEIVKAKPTNLPPPTLAEADLVVGNDAIGVGNLMIGATVDIYYEEQGKQRESIGGAVAPWTGTIFHVKPLKAAWVGCQGCIKAEQSLCDTKATSAGATVKGSLDPPEISRPVCAGSSEVSVCNTFSNSKLKLLLKSNGDKQIAQQGGEGRCTPVTIGGQLVLKDGDEIFATHEVGTLKSQSATVQVVDKSPPTFAIGNGKLCPPCSGQDYGPIFVRDTLTNTGKDGPVFKATMCGAENAIVEVSDPNGALLQSITLEEIKGKKGYFEGTWDWSKIGWTKYQDIPLGKYTATFNIWPTGQLAEKKVFSVTTTQGCVELEVLCAHNKVRAQVSAADPSVSPLAPLTWSATLADHAQKWADHLDTIGTCDVHDKSVNGIEGENLASGTSSYTDAIDLWGYEQKCFKNDPMPDIYNGQCDTYTVNKCNEYKDWRCAGHYSQIVWRNTKEVGCGMRKGCVVCRYSPAGNWTGEKAY